MSIQIGSKDVLKADALIKDDNYFLRYAQNTESAVRGDQASPKNADEFVNDRAVGRVNRIAKQTNSALRSALERSDVGFQANKWIVDHAEMKGRPELIEKFAPEEGRINSSALGEAFTQQLTSVVPFYFTEPTRGITFDFLPKISQGGMAGQDIKVQAYSGRQGLFVPYGENPTDFSTIEVEGKEIDVPVISLTTAMEVGVKETAFVAEYSSMAKYQNYNPNTGFVNPIVAKMDYLDKYYKLTHDSIAWYGSYNPATQNSSLGLTNLLTTSDIPSYTAPSGNFADLTTDQKSNLLVNLGNAILRQSKSTLRADTLFIDLYSFTQLMVGYSQYKDTVTLNNLIANGMFSAIIPVAAWSDIAPTQTTMIACNNRVSTWFYNMALPLTAVNPLLQGFELTIPYITRTSGMTIVNKLGLARLTMPLGDITEGLTLASAKKAK